jgi:argininosuccinate lyase
MTSDKVNGIFLEQARLGERNDVLIEFDERSQFPRMRRLYKGYALVDLAHAIMLVEQKIVTPDRGAKLIEGLLAVHDLGPSKFPWLQSSSSFLVHVEHYLSETVGKDIAGWLQTARSRNDQDAAAERVAQRDLLLRLSDALGSVLAKTIDLADRHADTLMPGYTHFQHAQPWTFGHYLMREVSILGRDMERLNAAYARTNLSALGGAANAGTSWPIDRRRCADLLGHDGLVFNSCDAGEFIRDYIEENTACISMMSANLGHFATDLYIWSGWEFAFIEVADGLAGTSSIMPQKKNPHALERVKAVGGQAIGWLATIMGSQRSALSTDLDYAFGDDLFGEYARASYASIRLMDEVVGTLIVNKERMASFAAAFWSTTSHLADELVRRYDLPFRITHQIVGRFVRDAVNAGESPSQVSSKLLVDAARDIAGITVAMSDFDLRDLLDARRFVETRTSEGSVSPSEVRRHVRLARIELEKQRAVVSERARTARAAIDRLLSTARAIAGQA